MDHPEVLPIQFNLRTPTPKSHDSPRCMLRIPEFVTPEMLKTSTLMLPRLPRAHSTSNSPLPLSPRIAKNKDIEFPEIHDRYQQDNQIINAKLIRGMKKHSSDKGLRVNKDQDTVSKFPTWVATQEELAKQGIFIIKN